MGLFKQMKDTKGMVEDAPTMVGNARALAAQAQEKADYEPISGVSLEQYAVIAKGVAAVGYDQARGPEIAAAHGVSADNWQAAFEGWNERIKGSPVVAGRFNALYTGRA